MSSGKDYQQPLQVLTPELRTTVIEKTESVLLKIVRANLNTQYASKAPLLAEFRDAIAARGSVSDTELVQDFRRSVPFSDYDAYKPFMVAFDAHPCKESEIENLFAPGLPYLLAVSSATSGKEPKAFPKYNSRIPSITLAEERVAVMWYQGYRDIKCVERKPGQIVKKILVSSITSGGLRASLGWTNVDEDEARMPLFAPGYITPFAASLIAHYKSFLIMQALFALAYRDIDRLLLTFSTVFYDLVRYIDEEWDLLLSSIEHGSVPHLPGVDKVHSHLQANFHANPDRAVELREIGPPFSCEGWAARTWPKLKSLHIGCSGPFASVLPKVESIIGPTITICPSIYASSESFIGVSYRNALHTFVLQCDDLVEFLDITAEDSHESLVQTWELEVGKQYEVVLTTGDGLWRYQLGDIIQVVGFDPNSGFPVFVLSGRRSLSIRLAPVLISDSDIMSSIDAISPDVIQANEFTTVADDRHSTPTVGYLIELAGDPDPNAHLAPQKLSDALAAVNSKFHLALQDGKVRIPSVRILQPGTFAAFRQWKAESNTGPGQVKVPVVLLAESSRKWILERVVGEL